MYAVKDHNKVIYRENTNTIATWAGDGSLYLNILDTNIRNNMRIYSTVRPDSLYRLDEQDKSIFVNVLSPHTTTNQINYRKFMDEFRDPSIAAIWAITNNLLHDSLPEEADNLQNQRINPFAYMHGFGLSYRFSLTDNSVLLNECSVEYPICFLYDRPAINTVPLRQFLSVYPDVSDKVRISVDNGTSAGGVALLPMGRLTEIPANSKYLEIYSLFLENQLHPDDPERHQFPQDLQLYLQSPETWDYRTQAAFREFISQELGKRRPDLKDYLDEQG